MNAENNLSPDDQEPQAQSPTAAICERLALYGGTPSYDELDSRELWEDRETVLAAVAEAFATLAQGITAEGTQLHDEREQMLWGFVNLFHAQAQRLDRAVDGLSRDLKDLMQAQDGSEVAAWELERKQDRTRNLGDRRDAFEIMRDFAADAYMTETSNHWRPRRGSHVSKTGVLTSAAVEARDYIKARAARDAKAHTPAGTLIAIASGRDASDVAYIWSALDKVKAKYADMVVMHGGGNGADRIVARWAEKNGVAQVTCKPDWKAHGRSAAPFRRNDTMLDLEPKAVIAFKADSGFAANLVDKARQRAIPVYAPKAAKA